MAKEGSKRSNTQAASSAAAPNFKLCGLPSRECHENIEQHDSVTSLHTALLQRLSLPQSNVILEFHLYGESCDLRRPIVDFDRWADGDLKDELFYLHTRQEHPAEVPLFSKTGDAGRVSRPELRHRFITQAGKALTRELGSRQLQTVWLHRRDDYHHVEARRTG